MVNEILDTSDKLCPIPVLKARRALESLEIGDTLTMLATDMGAKKDVANFCKQNGHTLSDMTENAGTITFVIVKGA